MKRPVQELVSRLLVAVEALSPGRRKAVSLLTMLVAALGVLAVAWLGKVLAACLGALVLAAQLLVYLDTFHGVRPRRPTWLRRRTPIRIRQRPH
ncbi:hypothetical protein [Luteimonas terricola]|uniref:DUF2892 domain-containing protein n=1 Tax=Luteimonas terricola TaxID=645597 RepID=A0ABQ2EGN9_9GAMM|nr:hypothetical protein [Luteimonas terricola]GGK08502.1 hypothetical protein GCM10011394_17350 [Luteimonas terricola]